MEPARPRTLLTVGSYETRLIRNAKCQEIKCCGRAFLFMNRLYLLPNKIRNMMIS